jgi:hypothetical protein
MLQHEAVTALLKTTTLARETVEAAAQDVAVSEGDNWGPNACAKLALRTLAPSIPYETFLSDVAGAEIAGVEIVEPLSTWRAVWPAASRTPYAALCDYSPDYADRSKLKEQEIAAEQWLAQLLACDEASRVTTWH